MLNLTCAPESCLGFRGLGFGVAVKELKRGDFTEVFFAIVPYSSN